MSLYEIVKSLQEAQGNIAKQAILMQHKDNELFKEYMRVVYDPGINYWIKKIPKYSPSGMELEFNEKDIEEMIRYLAERVITGNAAQYWLEKVLASLNKEGQELVEYMIKRSIGASVGDTMVLKTWPDLYFTVPYQRCSLLDAKAKEKFSKLGRFFCQTKCDGQFGYIVKRFDGSSDVITRAGSRYPKEFAEKMTYGMALGKVIVGELEVYADGSLLDRKTGNGVLNSVLKDGELPSNYQVKSSAWDLLTEAEFVAGKSVRPYRDRLESLEYEVDKLENGQIDVVQTVEVSSLQQAYEVYADHTARGLEGCVIKTEDFLWKDGTSKDCIKLKIEFEIDLKITGVVEGTGKASGMMGALQLSSSCGKLVTDVGTGFDDATRKQFWQGKDNLVGMIVAVKANDIISKRDRDTKSLFLPVFLEERLDKTVADSLEECIAQLEAAKGCSHK